MLTSDSSALRSTRLLDESSFNNSAAETSWLTTEPSVRRPEVGAELRREAYINPSEASQTRLPSITASERLPLRLPLAVYLRLFVLLPKSDASPNPSPRIFTNCTAPSHNLLLFLNHHLLLRFSNYVIFSLCWLWWMPRSLRDGKVKILTAPRPESAAASFAASFFNILPLCIFLSPSSPLSFSLFLSTPLFLSSPSLSLRRSSQRCRCAFFDFVTRD